MIRRLGAFWLAVFLVVFGFGPALAFDANAVAARMKELGIKPQTYLEPTPKTAAEATYISLSKVQGLTDADIKMIAGLPKLSLLALSNPDALQLDRLRILMAVPGLTRLNLFGATVNDEALAIIATASKLKDIDMREAKGFTPAGIGQLAKLLQLEHLQLDGTALGDDAFAPFANHPTVFQFDLGRSTGLTDKVLDHFGTMPKLGYLHVQKTGLTLGGFARMKNAAAMKRLRLDGIAVKSADVAILATFSNLFQLSISETGADDALVAALPKLPKLREIDLRKTQISDATIAALSSNKELGDLNIAETAVSDAPFKGVVWPDLRRVNAPGTMLTDAVLADAIRQPKLEAFYAEKTKVTKDGIAAALAKRPEELPKLKITN
jgi:hypothetical protein